MPYGKRVYWPGLLRIVRLLCKYKRLWGAFLPDDLPEAVLILLAGVEAACAALESYDKSHPRGGRE